MREINDTLIQNEIKKLLIDACYNLDNNLLICLNKAYKEESSLIGKNILEQIIENSSIAKNEYIPICQDTGIAVIFLEIGQDIHIMGNLNEAINNGVKAAYEEGFLRNSVVIHPLNRLNTNDNTPAIIHTKIVLGDKIKITVCPKGAGSENMSTIKMLNPTDGLDGVKKFVIDTIKSAHGKPCPPIIVGVGIGGNFEKSAILSKEALLRPLDDTSSDEICRQLEEDLLKCINDLDIGPMGLGGKNTALAVKVNYYPCHIASLPVAVNIQCHVARHKEVIL